MDNTTGHSCKLETIWQVSGFESARQQASNRITYKRLPGWRVTCFIGSLTGRVREKTAVEELLNQIGWSARYFADRLGIDERTVQKWKSGRSQGASYRIAMLYLELVSRNSRDVATKHDEVFRPPEEHW